MGLVDIIVFILVVVLYFFEWMIFKDLIVSFMLICNFDVLVFDDYEYKINYFKIN